MSSQNQDLIKSRKKLADDLQKKSRESRFFEKQCQEYQRELQSLRSQLERSSKGSFGNTSNNSHHTLEEAKKEKAKNNELSARLFLVENELQEKNIRMKVLEDALAFRSEEIGLAGHGDLLRRIVQLKGELKGVKEELSNRSNEANSLEQDNCRLKNDLNSSQRQIETLTERLAQSEQDLFKFSNTDVAELLKRVENERDLLLEYSQQDMTQRTIMANRIEQLEAEVQQLKINKQESDTIVEDLRSQTEQLHEQLRQLQDAASGAAEQNKSLSAKLQESEQLSYSLKVQLEHKIKAEEEILKNQQSLTTQSRTKDKDLMQLTEEVTMLRVKVEEQNKSLISANKELSQCHSNVKDLVEEVSCFKNKSINLESDNRVLSINVNRLELENSQLKKSLQEQSMELLELRPLKFCLDDMSKDLEQFDSDQSQFQNFNGPASPIQSIATTTPVKSRFSLGSVKENELISQLTVQSRLIPHRQRQLSPSSSHKRQGASDGHLSVSQQHSVWIGLPSIRKLHPKLYEKIRKIAQDLHAQESRCQDLQHQYNKLLQDATASSNDSEGKIAYLMNCHESDQETITLLTGKLHAMESDYRSLQNDKVCLNQIRTIIGALSEHPFLLELREEIDSLFRDRMIEGKKVCFAHLRSFLKCSFDGDNSFSENDLSLFVEKLQTANVQSIVALKESLQAYDKVEKEMQLANDELQRLRNVTHEQSLKIHSLEVETNFRTNKLQHSESDIQQQLTMAADLAEKQNSLIMSLEAKLESLQRDCQLKKAQISAIHHREEALRIRLLQYCQSISRPIPTNNPNLSELVELLTEGNINFLHSVNNTSVSNASYETPRRRYMDKSELEPLLFSTSSSRASSHTMHSLNEDEKLSVSKLSKSFSDRLSSHNRKFIAENTDIYSSSRDQQSQLARSLSASYSSSSTKVQSIQERIQKAQESFRAIRDSASKIQ